MSTESTNLSQKVATNFYCKKCNYTTSKKYDYYKHINTSKHKNQQESTDLSLINEEFKCTICNKCYKDRSGLWRHKKICKEKLELESNNLNEITNINEIIQKDDEIIEKDITVTDAKLVFELLKQNNEFKELMLTQTNQMMTQMMEIAKTNNSNNINNGTINNNNNYNQFNLQLYLNETCKNAMTIDEFLDYLQPTLEELEATAHLGYVEGITRIIMRGLKDLEEELRPFHCSDLKRESLFVKNPDGEWEKETDEKPLMLKFVKAVARKNFNNVNKWRQEHPNCRYHDSKSNDMFNQIMLNSTSGRTEEEQKASYEKIIKNITKEIVIDKSKKNKPKKK
jgi:hypothetical protein